tara:strand:+ start:646 stop:1443 length:798 start_codon:yes stop_codon:yes gene_type:complete
MATLSNYLRGESVAVVQSDTASLTLSSINIIPSTGSDRLLVSGDVVIIICADTGFPIQITLNSDVTYTGAKLNFASTTVKQLIPAGSIVILDKDYKYRSLFREYTTVNIPMVVKKNNSTNNLLRDSMITAVFDEDAGSVLSDGDSVDADFSSLYSSFLTPSNGAKIENIKYTLNTTSATGRNCTISLFELPIAVNSNSSQSISLIEEQAFTSQNDATYNFYRSNNLTHTLAANTCIMPTFKATGSVSNSDAFIANIEILISFDPR